MKRVTKGLLIGCGGFAALTLIVIVGVVIWVFSSPEGGVRLSNEMEPYAVEYIDEHELLEPGEQVLAYYDVTISMDGTEAAILTTDRVLYHNNGRTTSIPIDDIETIRHRYETLTGDIFLVQSKDGQVLKIEIAPLNQGETFKSVLESTWEKHKSRGSDD